MLLSEYCSVMFTSGGSEIKIKMTYHFVSWSWYWPYLYNKSLIFRISKTSEPCVTSDSSLMTWMVVEDELDDHKSMHVSSVPFRLSVMELIRSVETRGKTFAPDILVMVSVVELLICWTSVSLIPMLWIVYLFCWRISDVHLGSVPIAVHLSSSRCPLQTMVVPWGHNWTALPAYCTHKWAIVRSHNVHAYSYIGIVDLWHYKRPIYSDSYRF